MRRMTCRLIAWVCIFLVAFFACLGLLLTWVFKADARPIDPRAIQRAEKFWAPYNGGVLPCGPTLSVTFFTKQNPFGSPGDLGLAYLRRYHFDSPCHMWMLDGVTYASTAKQCAVIAHELGHSYFDLLDDNYNRSNLMFYQLVIPGRCKYD